MPERRFLIIGGGNMAQAITEGALRAGDAPSRFLIVEPDPAKRQAFGARGISAFASIRELGPLHDQEHQILLAVKPQSLPEVARDLAPLNFGGVVISILAGTPTARIQAALSPRARIVRAMPNTPARISLGCTALALGAGATHEDAAAARTLFSAMGIVLDLNEDLFDAFTALAGSGPAYLFLLAEAMTRAGVETGLPGDAADRATRQTLIGAATLLADSPQSPGTLRAAVTSRGGTTEAALKTLDEHGVADAIVRAVIAARDRGRELSP